MKFLNLFLILFIALPSIAKAQNRIEKVEERTLKLFGKGIRDKTTDASITIACIGDANGESEKSCDSVRWVVYVKPGEAYFLGAPVPVQNERTFKKYLKSIGKKADQASSNGLLGAAVIAGGLGSTVLILSATAGGPIGLIASLSVHGLIWFTAKHWAYNPSTVWMGDHVDQSENHNGWNWSTSPRKVSHRYFASVMQQISLAALNRSIYPGSISPISIAAESTDHSDQEETAIRHLVRSLNAAPQY